MNSFYWLKQMCFCLNSANCTHNNLGDYNSGGSRTKTYNSFVRLLVTVTVPRIGPRHSLDDWK